MLRLSVVQKEHYDPTNEDSHFIKVGITGIIEMENSLQAMSKWESIWGETFMDRELTEEESTSYIQCMTITPNIPKEVFETLNSDERYIIKSYLKDSRSATKLPKPPKTGRKKLYTTEKIYQMMVAQNIPFDCDQWNINRLFNLLALCGLANKPKKKMTRAEMAEQQKWKYAENERRRQQLNTKG